LEEISLRDKVFQDPSTLRRAHSSFLDKGRIPGGLLPKTIERSWTRCAELGLPADRIRDLNRISDAAICREHERAATLVSHAMPVMEHLYQQIAHTHSMVILSDEDGLILHSIGDPDFISKAEAVALQPGVSWAENQKGTNAIGTAIIEKAPVIVFAAQHYVTSNHFLTCSASPILNPFGKMVGILDITGDYRSHQHHTLALVRMAVQMIESRLFAMQFPNEVIVSFHPDAHYLGSLSEGKMVFSAGSEFIAANSAARQLLGFQSDYSGDFNDMFDIPFEQLLLRAKQQIHPILQTRVASGKLVYIQVQQSPIAPILMPGSGREERAKPAASHAAEPIASRNVSLDDLATGDERVAAAISKVRKILGRDIPVLIQGESGTGKEWLANAIHHSGPRARQPFVAVNCAAIPEGLIESELFGYEEGAFTGAKRKGASGKIQQAHGGTLFLDEIGDMPMSLQARLLRVLQERAVVPLGAAKSTPVDVMIICATNQKIRDMVASGQFREDLYYRINGLTIILPPLRERGDIAEMAQRIAASEAQNNEKVAISAEVMAIFCQHPWPGNIRQMSNALRAALALTDPGCEITPDCLPDDFLEDISVNIHQKVDICEQKSVSPSNLHDSLEDMETLAIRRAIETHSGNISAAARQLGISRNTLYRKMKVEQS
jgi:sigma-54 dependent transcriptional regulator, acetoin dehydrogenase operon transcriptional activator AcoR